jgi:hypothetical protein
MEIFKNTPSDIVNHILSYDKRFITNFNIVNKFELEIQKYKDINRQLVIWLYVLLISLIILMFLLIIILYN